MGVSYLVSRNKKLAHLTMYTIEVGKSPLDTNNGKSYAENKLFKAAITFCKCLIPVDMYLLREVCSNKVCFDLTRFCLVRSADKNRSLFDVTFAET